MLETSLLENVFLLNAASFLLLTGVIILQLKTSLLARENNHAHISIKNTLFHSTSSVQTQRLNKKLLRRSKDILEKSADHSTDAVEAVHRSIADMTFDAIDVLASTDQDKANTQVLRNIHNQSAKGVYRSIRQVNREIGGLADTLLNIGKPNRSRKNSKKPDP